ncbi:hypothetical protein FHR32_007954 [Streptosporangium album]|uniref:Lipoprotein n=1 Tax=Streptosporangium album TaxID=47479 RepID=A0A7W7S445_9ACTN|nr:hypothetical protein [Streptosporangium album]MBB4943554.1 hypothetical protein [Streptosporangium album]
MRKRYPIVTSTGVVALALTASCAGDPADLANAPTVSPKTATGRDDATPEGFKRIGGPANGLTVALPRSWIALDLTRDDLEGGLKRSGLTGRALEQARQSLQPLVINKAVWAFDPGSRQTSPSKFTTNLNGYCQPSATTSAQELISAAGKELEQLNAKVTQTSTPQISGIKAARLVYSFPAGGLQIKGTQFYLPAPGKTCTLTLSTDQDGKQRLFDQIGETTRLP